MLLLLLSRFSFVRLCATPKTGRLPTRLPCLWDSPGKNTGLGCHFLLQCMKVKSESHSVVSDSLQPHELYSPPGSSVHGIFPGKNTGVGCYFLLQKLYAAAAKSLQLCPTVWLHRLQPTRLPCLWDSAGKNTGVGCHFLLQCMKVNGLVQNWEKSTSRLYIVTLII